MTCDNRERIGFHLKVINNLMRRKMDINFSEAGLGELSGVQGPIIGFIYDQSKKQDIFQKDIEKAFDIRRSTATVTLQNLELKGFIIREAVDYDARLKKIVATPKAEQYHLRIREKIISFDDAIEQGITQEEKKDFFRILDKLKENITKM